MTAGTKVGDRVALVSCSDPHTRLTPGELGTVSLIDSLGTVHVKWDSGARLGLIPEAGDSWVVVRPPDPDYAPRANHPERFTDGPI